MMVLIRHRAALILGWVLLAVMLAACGGGTPEPTPEPTPDIEATVEARVKEKQAEDAALESKAQAIAKAMFEAMVEATAQALPTSTPVPPTPTAASIPPTPTQTPLLSSTLILANAKKAMAELESYKLDMEIVIKTNVEGMALEIPVISSGHFQAPDGFHMTTSGNMMGFLDFGGETIQIGGKQYEKESGEAEWVVSEEVDTFDSFLELFLNLPIVTEPVLEEFDGKPAYYMDVDFEGESEISAAMQFLGGSESEDLPETVRLEIWVDIESFYVRELILTMGTGAG